MENIKLPILLTMIGIFVASCGVEPEKDLSEIYYQKSAKLVNQILSENISCECILEPSSKTFIEVIENDMPEIDILSMRKYTMDQLNIEKSTTLDSMINLAKKFNLKKILKNTSIKFVDRNELDSIHSIEALKKWNKRMSQKCPNNLCYISEPVFNAEFTLVRFNIGYSNYSCSPRQQRFLKFFNGKWNSEDYEWD